MENQELIIDNTEELLSEELTAEAAESDVEQSEIAAQKPEDSDKLFTLRFRIPLEDYYQFHLIMGRENLKKGKRKTQILGLMELIFGVVFLVSVITTQVQASFFYYFIIAVLICMGLYGLTYYRFFYEKSLYKMVSKQHAKTPYLQKDIVVDFYPTKCVERIEENSNETFWYTIKSFRTTETLYMIMLDERRCMLIPKSQIGEQKEAFEKLMGEVCENFEKPRYEQ